MTSLGLEKLYDSGAHVLHKETPEDEDHNTNLHGDMEGSVGIPAGLAFSDKGAWA